MEGKTTLLAILSLLAFLVIYKELISKQNETLLNISYIMILGGILGNFYDRLVLNHVIDYISVIIFNYHFPIFNFADMLIVIGVLLLIYELWKDEKKMKLEINEETGRIDVVLSNILDESRSKIQRKIKEGKVLVNNKEISCNYQVTKGDSIEIFKEEITSNLEKNEIPLDIVF